MYFGTNNLNVSVEACSFAKNYAQVVKSYLALGIESKGVVRSLPLYLRPSPLAGCLGAWLAGERHESKQTGGGQAATAGVFCPPARAQKKQNQGPFLLLFFLNRAFFDTSPPFFSLFSTQEWCTFTQTTSTCRWRPAASRAISRDL